MASSSMRSAICSSISATPLATSTARRKAAFPVFILQHSAGKQHVSRSIHTSPAREKPVSASPTLVPTTTRVPEHPVKSGPPTLPATAILSLSQVVRTYLITSISSSPFLLGASTSLLRQMLNSRNPLFRIDSNPLMRSILWHTFYKQFCTGETTAQVKQGCQNLREQGYSGVILEYALEVLKDAEGDEAHDVAFWRKALLDTVVMTEPGDFIGLKWSGMGPAAMKKMAADEQPTERMMEAMHALCKAAREKGVFLLPAAEETWSLKGFNNWTMMMQRAYNLGGKSVVYNTYQAYLKQTPANLARHLEEARKEGFTLCAKMVRGAYLGSDDRSKIHPTAEDTHNAYDGIASALIHRKYNDILKAPDGSTGGALPPIAVVLATHNAVSVQKAQAVRQEQVARGEQLTDITFAQLQGMADEVSCSLIALAKEGKGVKERVFKCTTWGPMFECLNYLLRRASENKDAAGRTQDTRRAMGAELRRRMRGVVGLA